MPDTSFDNGRTFSSAPELFTARLRLFPFSERHFTQTYVDWLNDPVATRFSEQRHVRHSLESCRAYVSSFAASANHLWAIEDLATKHVGNISASVDLNNQIADIAILLGSAEVRGKGYGSEAWMAVLQHLLSRGDIAKVTGGCLSSNTAMIKVMAACKMVPDGKRLNHFLWEGQRVDLVYFASWR